VLNVLMYHEFIAISLLDLTNCAWKHKYVKHWQLISPCLYCDGQKQHVSSGWIVTRNEDMSVFVCVCVFCYTLYVCTTILRDVCFSSSIHISCQFSTFIEKK